MLQEALDQAVKFTALPPALEAFAWPDQPSSPSAEQFEASMRAKIAVIHGLVSARLEEGQLIRRHLWDVFETFEVRPSHVTVLTHMIEATEAAAAEEARDHRQVLKRLAKSAKRLSEMYPRLKLFLAWVDDQLEQSGRREIGDKADFALFLRALRAKHEDKTESGDFLGADDLEKLLTRAL